MWYKSCPRCERGDIMLSKDEYGWHIQCVQCAFIKDMDDPREASDILRGMRLSRAMEATAA